MNINELTDLIINERLSLYFKQNREHGIKENQRSEEFQRLLKEKAPNLLDAFGKYLDSVTELDAADNENIYLFGVHDGIRLMRDIISTR